MAVINFFGAPGAGKSTAALGLANEMKRAWLNCEYISEFAKDQVWADTSHLLSKQNWIFANQDLRLSVMSGKVDFVVTDSPLPLSAFYAPADYPACFTELCFHFFHMYKNVNFFINRSHKYTAVGRLQNEEESDEIAEQMKAFLRSHNVSFIELSAGDSVPGAIMAMLRTLGAVPASMAP